VLIPSSGLAELAGAIGNGPLVAVGKDVSLVKLVRREDQVEADRRKFLTCTL
jgi:hypothetical protein